MENIVTALNKLHDINTSYSLSNQEVEKILDEIKTAKVCTPVIGKFSSGKSALLNTLLGYTKPLLKEDITPETAVPAEITYSPEQDFAYVVTKDGTQTQIDLAMYRHLEVDANEVRCIRLNLRNNFLETIPDVMLVDMPGFESGFEVHNKAIDNYLPNSMVYLITFPADDMILRSSVGNILKELCLHDMPICIVITKYDKCDDNFETTFAALKESLKKYIGQREVTYCITSSRTGDAEELEKFLEDIQQQSQVLLANRFKIAVLSSADVTRNYLVTTMKNSEMSESELDEQQDKLDRQLDSLNQRLSVEREDFDSQVAESIREIKNDIQMALEAEEETFVAIAMNNQNIQEQINLTVRKAVTVSMKKRFIPKVERYLKRVQNCLDSESIGDVHFSFSFNAENVNKNIFSAVLPAIGSFLIGLPVLGIIISGIMLFVNKFKADQKREEMKNQIRSKLHGEVYPQILQEVGKNLEMAIFKQLKLINTSMDEEITNQRTTLEKALEDVRQRMTDEKEQKEGLLQRIKDDLDKIQQICSEVSLPE